LSAHSLFGEIRELKMLTLAKLPDLSVKIGKQGVEEAFYEDVTG
jgi:hypothetical protein